MKGSGPGSPRSGDTGPGGTSGSSVWEGSENRKWELVVEEEQMIPSSNRVDVLRAGPVDPDHSILGFLDSFTEEQAIQEPGQRIVYSSEGAMMARIDDSVFTAPPDHPPRRIKKKRRKRASNSVAQQSGSGEGPSGDFEEGPSGSTRQCLSGSSEGPSGSSVGPSGFTGEGTSVSTVEGTSVSTGEGTYGSTGEGTSVSTGEGTSGSTSEGLEPDLSEEGDEAQASSSELFEQRNSRSKVKRRAWWKRKKEAWKRKRASSASEGGAPTYKPAVSISVESSPGRDSPSPSSLRRILNFPLGSPEYLAPSPGPPASPDCHISILPASPECQISTSRDSWDC